jgi:hypothetical protein
VGFFRWVFLGGFFWVGFIMPTLALDARNSLKFSAYSPNTANIRHRRLISSHIFSEYAESSVADPWHFDVDPDLDPRIHASDLWIRILFIFRYRV